MQRRYRLSRPPASLPSRAIADTHHRRHGRLAQDATARVRLTADFASYLRTQRPRLLSFFFGRCRLNDTLR